MIRKNYEMILQIFQYLIINYYILYYSLLNFIFRLLLRRFSFLFIVLNLYNLY